MKKFSIALITLVSLSAFAKSKEVKPYAPTFRAVTYFKYKDGAGKQHKETLHVEAETVHINHSTLPKALWKKGEPAMKVATNTKPTDRMMCPGAMYTLRVSRNEKKSVTESGCMSTPRFKELQDAFAKLKGLVPK